MVSKLSVWLMKHAEAGEVRRVIIYWGAYGVKLYFEFHGMPAPTIVEHFAKRGLHGGAFHS